jgi:hypothetical protein
MRKSEREKEKETKTERKREKERETKESKRRMGGQNDTENSICRRSIHSFMPLLNFTCLLSFLCYTLVFTQDYRSDLARLKRCVADLNHIDRVAVACARPGLKKHSNSNSNTVTKRRRARHSLGDGDGAGIELVCEMHTPKTHTHTHTHTHIHSPSLSLFLSFTSEDVDNAGGLVRDEATGHTRTLSGTHRHSHPSRR